VAYSSKSDGGLLDSLNRDHHHLWCQPGCWGLVEVTHEWLETGFNVRLEGLEHILLAIEVTRSRIKY